MAQFSSEHLEFRILINLLTHSLTQLIINEYIFFDINQNLNSKFPIPIELNEYELKIGYH